MLHASFDTSLLREEKSSCAGEPISLSSIALNYLALYAFAVIPGNGVLRFTYGIGGTSTVSLITSYRRCIVSLAVLLVKAVRVKLALYWAYDLRGSLI
jgi:hypothetical protein